MTRSETIDVLIAGGGIAGLSAAWELEKKRRAGVALRYQILEAGGRLGGKILTEREGPLLLEGGPDSFIALKPGALNLCKELGLESELVPAEAKYKTVYVYLGGRLRRLPPELMLARPPSVKDFLGSELLSWPGKLRAVMEPMIRARPDPEETLGSFIRRRFGREMLENVIEPLAAGVYAGIADKMSLRDTFPRLSDLEIRFGSVIRGLRSERGISAFGEERPAFLSLSGGLGRIVETLAGKIPAETIALGKRVKRFEGKIGADFVFQTENGEAYQARSVIFACPAYEASWILRQIDGSLAELEKIPYSHSAVITLAYRRASFPSVNSFGFLVARKERSPLLGVSFPSVKFPGRAPQDTVLLRCFLGGAANPEIIEKSDGELESLARSGLEKILNVRGAPEFARVYRWPKSNPQYLPGHSRKIAAIRSRLALQRGLFLAGAGYDGVGIPDCVESGRAAARQVLAFLKK